VIPVLNRWYFRHGVWLHLKLRRRLNRTVLAVLQRTSDQLAAVYWRVRDFLEHAERTWDFGPRLDGDGEVWNFGGVPASSPTMPVRLCGACGQVLPGDSGAA
jgi:hypothetical protein